MSFYIQHRFGGDDSDPPPEALAELVRELDDDPDDPEHVNVAVVHDSDWAVGVYQGGLVTLENVEDLDKEPKHMYLQDRDDILRLLGAIAEGRLDEVFAQPWRPGYGATS